jgi:hypothetical protein
MTQPRITLLDLMGVVLLVASVLGTIKLCQEERISDGDSAFGIYLAVLCIATMGSFAKHAWRPFWRGVAFFGWLFLVFALRFGIVEGYQRAKLCLLAIPLGAICGLVSWWFFRRERDPGQGSAVQGGQQP